jgi:hypothetical protein
MTNTLHRFSEHYAFTPRPNPAPVDDDFIVFAMPTRGVNDDRLVDKCRTFARLALRHDPVNLGDATHGGIYRPQRELNPLAHWRRDTAPDVERMMDGIDGHTVMAAVFRRREDMEAFVADLKGTDLGVSINISAPIDAAQACCRKIGIARHSVEYSVGFQGRVERLPESSVLEIGTMCGHGMVSHNLVKKLIEMVREGRRTPAEAAVCMARFCTCGVFNVPRAERLIERARTGAP